MTTHLQGDKTRFFPFNKRIENPVNPNGHKTAYLWEDILHPDNLMALINNFVHEQETTEKVYDPKIGGVKDVKHAVLVFPRYHQLDVIRQLEKAIKEEAVGHNYLSKLELYTKLSKSSNPEVNTDLKRQLYQAYLEQSSSNKS